MFSGWNREVSVFYLFRHLTSTRADLVRLGGELVVTPTTPHIFFHSAPLRISNGIALNLQVEHWNSSNRRPLTKNTRTENSVDRKAVLCVNLSIGWIFPPSGCVVNCKSEIGQLTVPSIPQIKRTLKVCLRQPAHPFSAILSYIMKLIKTHVVLCCSLPTPYIKWKAMIVRWRCWRISFANMKATSYPLILCMVMVV